MALTASLTRCTPEAYLTRDRAAERKSEYIAGEIVAVAGASRNHNLIAGNLFGELRQQLKGRPCEAYTGDMRLAVDLDRHFTYPDVMVVCGEPEFLDGGHFDTLLNPVLVVEVLSPTT